MYIHDVNWNVVTASGYGLMDGEKNFDDNRPGRNMCGVTLQKVRQDIRALNLT